MPNVSLSSLKLPPEPSADVLPTLRAAVAENPNKLVVLDDDPTGTQTVYDVPIYTDWSVATLVGALEAPQRTFYLLTNSRSLPELEAVSLARTLGENLRRAGEATGQPVTLISRSDSTLRGHYPAEVDALGTALGTPFDATVLIPAFIEGGRVTLKGVHYLARGDTLLPVGESEFAGDRAFGFHASDLAAWVEEKTAGRVEANMVVSVDLKTLRKGGADAVKDTLVALKDNRVVVVDAQSYRDLEVFTLGALDAEKLGKRFLYRSAASFVRTRAGLGSRPLLSAADLPLDPTVGGLVMVGSYVPTTNRQLQRLLERADITGVELSVPDLLNDATYDAAVYTAARTARELIRENRHVVIYTSRELTAHQDAAGSLSTGQRISAGLVQTLQNLQVRPRFLVAKGGITSSDLATRGLGVKRAFVKGQLVPGVPVWELGQESRLPGLTYVVFPGNVGGDGTLHEVVEMMTSVLVR